MGKREEIWEDIKTVFQEIEGNWIICEREAK